MNNNENKESEEKAKKLSDLFPKYQGSMDGLRETFKGYEKIQDELSKKNIDVKISDSIDLMKEMNFSGFLTISMLDSMILLNSIYETNDISEKRYFFKQGYLLVYEVLKTYNTHNKIIKPLISTKFPQLNEKHITLAKEIKLFKAKNNYDNHIVNIRNSIAGHIESTFSEYYDVITSLEEVKVFTMLSDFGELLNKIKKLSTELAKLSYEELGENLRQLDIQIEAKMKIN